MSITEVAGPLAAANALDQIKAGTVLLAVHGALFGYYASEVSIYLSRFQQDRIGFRILVAWLSAIEVAYIVVKIGGFVTTINLALGGSELHVDTLWLNFAPIVLTVTMEGSAEGFFCWRLCAVSRKIWMKVIAVALWCFSTGSHIIWVSMLGAIGGTVDDKHPKLRILLMMSFWGTAAENLWISTCLIYELAFSRDRHALKGGNSASISKLISLAMRTSAILIVFELLVAILVSVGGQDAVALGIETNFATTIYTVLCATVVLHTLNYRTKIRNASPTFSSPVFFAPTKSVSGSGSASASGGTSAGMVGSGIGATGGGVPRRASRATTTGTTAVHDTARRDSRSGPISSRSETLQDRDELGTVGEVNDEKEGQARRDDGGFDGSGLSRWASQLFSPIVRPATRTNDDAGSKPASVRKKHGKKSTTRDPESGGGSGIGVTVQTVSWVVESSRHDRDSPAVSESEMVIERGRRDASAKDAFSRPGDEAL